MTRWRTAVDRIAGELRARARAIARGGGTTQICTYRGYGTERRLHVLGRVLRDERIAEAGPDDSRWRNLVHTLKRLESDEVAGARLRVSAFGAEEMVTTDAEGYLRATLAPASPPRSGRSWLEVDVELLEPARGGEPRPRATAHVLVPPATARFGVISDVDDTIVRTDVTSLVRLARAVFLTNAHTRAPFPGVTAFYRALAGGTTGEDGNPIFYVSNSPWNLYDLLAQYVELQDLPAGPLLLRDFGRRGRTTIAPHRGRHKLDSIRHILKLYPHLPFVLIGDSGQRDPEIYGEIVHRFPRRVLAVYIRNVSRGASRARAIDRLAEEVRQAGCTLILADDTLAAARHAAEHGWIQASALDAIGAVKDADEAAQAREGRLETAPTITVGDDGVA